MHDAQAYDNFVTFMREYTDFLGRMRQDEADKLEAVASRELEKIEHSIAVSQANAKRLDNYETRRVATQDAAGFGGFTFRQLIAKAPGAEQDALWDLFSRFERNVSEIRFYNEKSMSIARDNMIDIDPAAVLPGQAGAKPNNPYEKIREAQHEQSNMILETKA